MSSGNVPLWLPIALTIGVLATSAPAMADRTTVDIHDEGTLLVGEPTGQGDLHVDQQLLGQDVDVGTQKTYGFTVDPAANRLEIDLAYDAGSLGVKGPCLKANDLDLFVEGPAGWQRSYPGCDDGNLAVLADDVPTGEYTVRVEASQGSTLCLPSPSSPCSSPGTQYVLEIQVWDVD